jgi:hypothetical protein
VQRYEGYRLRGTINDCYLTTAHVPINNDSIPSLAHYDDGDWFINHTNLGLHAPKKASYRSVTDVGADTDTTPPYGQKCLDFLQVTQLLKIVIARVDVNTCTESNSLRFIIGSCDLLVV